MTSKPSNFSVQTNHRSAQHDRVEWIDNLKGFILLLVCFLHLGIYSSGMLYLSPARMTTFFFLSGLLFSDKRYPTIKSYISHKSRFLLMPYLRLSFLFLFFQPSLHKAIYTEGFISKIQAVLRSLSLPETIQHYIINLYSNTMNIIQGNSTPATESLWFVFTLFSASCVFFIFNHYASKSKHKNVWYVLFAMICIAIGWTCNSKEIVLLFRFNVMFTALFFYQMGYYSKALCHKLTALASTKLFGVILLLLGIYHFTEYHTTIDLHYNILGDDFIRFLIKTTSGIFFFVSIFILASRYDAINIFGIFRNIARNALIILCMHLYLLNLGYAIFNRYTFTLLLVAIGTIISIPLFRNKLYWFIGKEKISIKESLSIK